MLIPPSLQETWITSLHGFWTKRKAATTLRSEEMEKRSSCLHPTEESWADMISKISPMLQLVGSEITPLAPFTSLASSLPLSLLILVSASSAQPSLGLRSPLLLSSRLMDSPVPVLCILPRSSAVPVPVPMGIPAREGDDCELPLLTPDCTSKLRDTKTKTKKI
jgi:hypothetical protein